MGEVPLYFEAGMFEEGKRAGALAYLHASTSLTRKEEPYRVT